MKLIKPNFWNYKKPNLTAYILIPISKIIEKILKIKKKKEKNLMVLRLYALEIFMLVELVKLQYQ